MHRSVKTVLVLVSVLVLAACSAPPAPPPSPPALSSKSATTALTTLGETSLLVSDDVPLSATLELSGKRKDKVVLRIEKSSDGTTWSVVDEVEAKGPKLELTTHSVADKAGPLQFRATATTTGKKPKSITSSEAQVATVFELQQLVRTLYYAQTQAYAVSPEAGHLFDEQHNYPGYADFTSAPWKEQAAEGVKAHEVQSAVPVLTTISPDPLWMPQGSTCSTTQTVPPAGRSFIVSVDFVNIWNGFPTPTKADVHVTFFNGNLYFWFGCR